MDARRGTISRARVLRSNTSLPEGLLWRRLRDRQLEGLRFRRQHPAGPYVLDFYCAAARLAVEVDGQHHHDEARKEHDAIRDRWLERQGIQVLRIPARVVLSNMDSAILTILGVIGARPSASPFGGGTR
ncbi:MAG: DUF559 domain-containing protein, partial [Caulobacteraceae bacterium]